MAAWNFRFAFLDGYFVCHVDERIVEQKNLNNG
jgi:hypothetical protein